ncbi:MAG: hypothetical protein RLZZ76_367 [Candidatus Parcubacteria bacterium]|jgi:hypothetical protein
MLTRKKIILVLSCLFSTLSLFGIAHFLFYNSTAKSSPHFDPTKALATLNREDDINDFLEIEQMIGSTMKIYGTKAGFELIDEGERQGIISNDACHGLLHYVGHAAYAENPTDYQQLLSVVAGTNCIGGYLHGIEAEIVLGSSNVIEDVQNFCRFQKERGVNPGPCYHGVGHAGTELYHYDVAKSLALCDALSNKNIETDLTNCYRGVFSEVGNSVTGYDGHTGLAIDSIAIPDLDTKNPYAYCERLAEKHQSSCKSQLTKVATMHLDMEDWLTTCHNPTLTQSTRNICININTGVYVRHHLSFSKSTEPPSHLYDFTLEEQKIGILGSAEAFAGYISDGATKDWDPFCKAIPIAETKAYCVSVFTRMTQNNEAPWMERTDIR